MIKIYLSVLASLALLVAAPASAHHSASSFDRTKPIAVSGTVKLFRWTNPHSWITLAVPDGKGGSEEWKVEGPSVSIMARNGWKSSSLKVGDRVRLLVAPNRDGSKGGEFLSVTKADGTVLRFGIV